ncbi:Motor neuron and pancreas homeobox protein 1 [Operophtera brumata]|uniref:Motor neuron and pancreas homeobox protein 1 n=1 Tax=Operophtera brumata TaxID=104452 RepID=A0A0L7LFH8_OPEBR|nr:Motor neuron and pancreas homeobox protein 1 [Operophtera brumata]
MSSQIQTMYRRDSSEKPLEIDQDSNPERSTSPKYYEEKTCINQVKKSFCIDALLSKQLEPEATLQERLNQQKYLTLIQNKNYIPRYQENYDTTIEQNTINKFREEREEGSPRSANSSPRSGSPGSDDGNGSPSGIIPKPGLLPQNPALVAAQSAALFNYPQMQPVPGGPLPSAFHHPGDRVLHHMQLEWLARTGMFYHRIPELGAVWCKHHHNACKPGENEKY